MYIPDDFRIDRLDLLHEAMAKHSFAMLVTHGVQGLQAHHLPFELDVSSSEFGRLKAHVARKNPIWQQSKNGDEVLIVFQMGDAYISPNWYPSKQQHHQQVPTWNYKVVHAWGKISIHDDEHYVRGVVARLTRQHEVTQAKPWKMGDAPKSYIEAMLQHIVGIEIEITRLQGQFKLGQNKDYVDILGAVEGLTQSGHTEMAEAMHEVAHAKLHNSNVQEK
ncbi:MAG: FMN-binding negative transcriptional regulator [Acinetobacter sp.]